MTRIIDRVYVISGNMALPYIRECVDIELEVYKLDKLETILFTEEILTIAITEVLRDRMGLHIMHNYKNNHDNDVTKNIINYIKDLIWNEITDYVKLDRDEIYIIRAVTVLNNIHIIISG